MRENDSQEVIYRYDHLSDTLGIKVTRNFKYDETIEMDDGILLDFDADGIPVSLEILDASKRFDLDAGSFKKINCLKADICIDKKSISINAALGVLKEIFALKDHTHDDIENKQIFQSHASNYAKIPDISTKLALV